jgi:hypothetical protein
MLVPCDWPRLMENPTQLLDPEEYGTCDYESPRHEAVWGSGSIAPCILLNLDAGRVVSFTPRPLCIRYPLDRRLCGPQSGSGRGDEEDKKRFCRDSNSGRPARGLVVILTELRRLVA